MLRVILLRQLILARNPRAPEVLLALSQSMCAVKSEVILESCESA